METSKQMEAIVSPSRMSYGLRICYCFPDNITSSQTTMSTFEFWSLQEALWKGFVILPPAAPNSAETNQNSHCPNAIMVVSVTSSEKGGIRTGGRNQLYNLGKLTPHMAPYWLPHGSQSTSHWCS